MRRLLASSRLTGSCVGFLSLDNDMAPDMAMLTEKRVALLRQHGNTLMPVAQRLTILYVFDKRIDIPQHSGFFRCDGEFRRHVEHGALPFPVTHEIVP